MITTITRIALGVLEKVACVTLGQSVWLRSLCHTPEKVHLRRFCSMNAARKVNEWSGFETESRSECRPNILVVNGDFPNFPGTGGLEFLNTTNLAGLAPHVGLVSMLHTADAAAGAKAILERDVELYLWKSPHIAEHPLQAKPLGPLHRLHARFASAVHSLKAFPARPHDAVLAGLNFRNMAAPLLDAVAKRHWNVVVVIQSSSAALIDHIPRADVAVVVMHDIRSVVFERAAKVARSWRERARLQREARRYFEFESKYLRSYDLVIALSEADANWIRKNYEPSRVEVVPMPVDTGYFAPPPDDLEHTARIVFTGMMDHPPNVDAAVFFAQEVFPRIREQVREAEFYIVGKRPALAVQELGHLPGVTVTGGVPDTRPYLAGATVVVVPLRFGSGVRHKILEGWGIEKCIVSTTLGAEGLPCENGKNIVIADGAPAMADAVIRAMNDGMYRRTLGHAGRQVAIGRHDPRYVAGIYYGHICSVGEEKFRNQPMHIALDMRWMTPGVAGGIENLARSFVSELISLDAHNSYTMILPSRCRRIFDLRGRSNFKTICRDAVSVAAGDMWLRILRRVHAALRLDFWRSTEVCTLQFLRSLEADIVYSFPGFIHPEVGRLRHVLVVPDIQHEYFPEFFSKSAQEERRRLYTASIQQADHICAISEFTRRTLIERLNVPPDKVTAVLLAADPIFRVSADPGEDQARLRKYNLPREPFLFFPAHTWRHKNHRTVLSAMTVLRAKYGLRPALICTGGAREAQSELEKQIDEDGLREQVRFLGYCPREDLPALYRAAGCLVFPSLFEGFGMPVLEAMTCGCPVVCSNTSSLPEVAGEAALLVDPTDAEGLADAIHAVLEDPELRQRLMSCGAERARRFSWRRHTVETLAVLHRVHMQLRNSTR